MKRIHYYEVWDDYSEDGRGGRIEVIGRFSYKEDAEEFAKGRGNYGNNASVSEKEFAILENIKEVEIEKDEKLKKRLKDIFSSEELNRIKELLKAPN